MKKNPYARIKHQFDNYPTPPPIATVDRVGGFRIEENGDFSVDENGYMKLTKKMEDGWRVGDIVFTFCENSSLGENWLEAAGQDLSRTKYPELFAVIGTKYGSGSSTTFKLPNFTSNGWFVRSKMAATPVGTVQSDTIRNITATIGGTVNTYFKSQSGMPQLLGAFRKSVFVSNGWCGNGTGEGYQMQQLKFDASDSVPTSNENRPVNISMRVLIKVK